MNIGENIRKYRREKDLKAEQIFEEIGISQSTYSKIENNRCKVDIATLIKIASVLNIDVVELLSIPKKPAKYDELNLLIKTLEDKIVLLKEQNFLLKEEIEILKKK
ncbi:helix-turn-helix transcriptional regulator [Flavobacterium sp. GN10]|uniref:Helix-turn-helix transcriptional regulator n=1 Tax=Flavobacterium tagetis TaxID=2801336 RepID=A0ABS1K815_9FLAO|nr:helix-turn-helix transcriptional regulator [Flavobacterium tagetis]MBL0735418.1 helix-turn-helix transcriptional regulator [Flavobacterium tagetis]